MSHRIRVQPGERLAVRLTARQRDLILEHTFVGGELESRIRIAEADGSTITARLDLDDLDELLGCVAAEANHSRDSKIKRALDQLLDRLGDVEDRYTDEEVEELFPLARPKYTPKQGQYLAFIYYYTKIHGQPPAEADCRRFFKVSPSAVHQMLLNLEERGLIERIPGAPRSVRLLLPRSEIPDLE